MRPGEGRLYLDKYNGKFLGVCAGIADYFGWTPIWIRLALVIGGIVSGTFPFLILIYFVIAVIVPKKPIHLYREDYRAIFGDDRDASRPARPRRKEDQ